MTVGRRRVLVAGGSIGGLTTALVLRDLGYDVEVFERSGAALQDRGAGIVVLPITERYFVERGGEDSRVSLELTDWSYVDRDDTIISADPDHFRFAGWNTIYRALMDAFDERNYHLDSEMVGFDQHDDRVTLHLADGRTAEGDLLVCADGIASTGRSILLPDVHPEYAGYVAWRGVVPESLLSEEARAKLADAMLYQVLDHSHILAYAMPDHDGRTEIGNRVINYVWYRNASEGDEYRRLMTDRDGVFRPTTMPANAIRDELVEEIHAVARRELAPTLADVVLSGGNPMIQAIFDLEVPQMVFGRICILGDAAFGLRPHVAAGQAKACADAWALAEALAATPDDVDTALSAWQERQLALGRSALERTKRMGTASQFDGTMVPGDPDWKFGLWKAGN